MKALQTILFLLGTISIYSQGFCEYGDYNFIFNTIKGIDKSEFKKIVLKNKNENLYERNFNKKGNLLNSTYNETIGGYSISIDNPCYSIDDDEIEQKKWNYKYEYLKSGEIKKVLVLSKNEEEKTIIYEYYGIDKKIKSIKTKNLKITHEYNKEEELRQVKRNGKAYTYFWNKKNRLKKIIISPTDYSYDKHLIFDYNLENSIHKITYEFYDKATRLKDRETEKVFCYSNNKLNKIISTGFKIKGNKRKQLSSIYYEFDYSNKDKLIINYLDENKKYINHYECYYH